MFNPLACYQLVGAVFPIGVHQVTGHRIVRKAVETSFAVPVNPAFSAGVVPNRLAAVQFVLKEFIFDCGPVAFAVKASVIAACHADFIPDEMSVAVDVPEAVSILNPLTELLGAVRSKVEGFSIHVHKCFGHQLSVRSNVVDAAIPVHQAFGRNRPVSILVKIIVNAVNLYLTYICGHIAVRAYIAAAQPEIGLFFASKGLILRCVEIAGQSFIFRCQAVEYHLFIFRARNLSFLAGIENHLCPVIQVTVKELV